MRYELKLTVSGMNKDKLDALYEFLDDNHYDYVGHENTYDEWEGRPEVHMNFEEYIKQMSHKEMQNFIYWVYQCGQRDAKMGAEDSPGDWSYFGGHMLKCPAVDVIKNIDEYYGEDWRDE